MRSLFLSFTVLLSACQTLNPFESRPICLNCAELASVRVTGMKISRPVSGPHATRPAMPHQQPLLDRTASSEVEEDDLRWEAMIGGPMEAAGMAAPSPDYLPTSSPEPEPREMMSTGTVHHLSAAVMGASVQTVSAAVTVLPRSTTVTAPESKVRDAAVVGQISNTYITPVKTGRLDIAVSFADDHAALRESLGWKIELDPIPKHVPASPVETILKSVDLEQIKYIRAIAKCRGPMLCEADGADILPATRIRTMQWSWTLTTTTELVGTNTNAQGAIRVVFEGAPTPQGAWEQLQLLPPIEGIGVSLSNPEDAVMDRIIAFLKKFKAMLLTVGGIIGVVYGWKKFKK